MHLKGQTMEADEMVKVIVTVMRDGRVLTKLDWHHDCADEAVGLLASGALAEAQRIFLQRRPVQDGERQEA